MHFISCQKVLLPAIFAGNLALVGCLQPADSILEKSDQAGKIVFVKQNSTQNNNNIAMAANPSEFYRGTDIVMLSPISPSGVISNLTAPYTRGDQEPGDWGAAEDPEISYDGRKMLFSMVKAGSRTRQWNLYEMDLPTGALTQLTSPLVGSDMDPAYLPDGRVVFTSTRNQIVDEYERRPAPQLFIGERGADGLLTNLRQLSFNQSHDQNPFVHSSGKIYFTRWDHLGNPNKMPLFSINPDGTGQFVLYGADETFTGTLTSGMRTFMEARELSDHGIISSIMERTSPYEGGSIGIIDLAAGISSPPTMITNTQYNFEGRDITAGAIFKTPYPIADHGQERILVAQSTADVGGGANGASNFDIYVMDKNGSNMRVVHLDPNYNDYDPVVVAPRPMPITLSTDPNVANGIATGMTTGFFFDANVYSRDRTLDGQMAPIPAGAARYLRVLEAIPLSTNGSLRGGSLGETNFEKQRVIGYADIQADGSFAIEVPAMKSLHVQTLDENGMTLVNQLQWIHVQPGERRVCTGCHGSRERDEDIKRIRYNEAVDSVYIDDGMVRNYFASFGRAQKVWQHAAARSDTAVDFYNPWALANDKGPGAMLPGRVTTLQSVLDRQCVSCHNPSTPNRVVLQEADSTAAAVKLDMDDNEEVSSVYRRLVLDGYITARGDTLPYAIYNVSSRGGGARQSPLAWVLYNKQLDGQSGAYRTTSYDHSTLWAKDGNGSILPFDAANADLRTLIEWLDMGGQFSNSTGDLTP